MPKRVQVLKDSDQILSELDFNESHVLNKLDSLRTDKAHGPDDISPKNLAQIAEQIAHPVYLIFKKSVDESTLPSDWKAANVSPIHNKNLAIANRSRVSCINTNFTMTLKSGLQVTQGH